MKTKTNSTGHTADQDRTEHNQYDSKNTSKGKRVNVRGVVRLRKHHSRV